MVNLEGQRKMSMLHSLMHKLDFVRFEPISQEDGVVGGMMFRVYLFRCPVCNKIESIAYWHNEPLVHKRWWQ